MWLIVLIIFIILVVLIVVLTATRSNIHSRGDYKDGGGKQFGGSENTNFFTPNNERAGINGERLVNYYFLEQLLMIFNYLINIIINQIY